MHIYGWNGIIIYIYIYIYMSVCARGIDIIRTYRYYIEQVIQTLISQTKLTNISVIGERVECTTIVHLAQAFSS